MISELKKQVIIDLEKTLAKLDIKEAVFLEQPKDKTLGDFAVPCFSYAKIKKENPNLLAKKIKDNLTSIVIDKTEVVGGYLNLFLNKKQVIKILMDEILTKQEQFGDLNIGKGKTIVLDYSHPNIAKSFSIGHLRSTVIGNAIRLILKKLGYKTVGLNYLGDYGTQFGKIICAYKRWGNEALAKKDPIFTFQKLYIRFHEEAKLDPSLDEEARHYFKRLEEKDEEIVTLWKWIRDESLKAFMPTYELLGIVDFDSYEGEATIASKVPALISRLEQEGLIEEDNGAKIIRLGEDIVPALISKEDGASLYLTRDLAAILERQQKYNFASMLYVVGNEQTFHFTQLKRLVAKLGYPWSNDIKHISFGLILQDGKKMSTRKGKSFDLQDLLEEAITLAKNYIVNKNPALKDKDEVSRQIGVGAIIFNDLKNYRTLDVDFNLEDILKFEGETGPYIQYTYARINSLLNNFKNIDININHINISEYIWNIIIKLFMFEDILIKAKNDYDPSALAKYIIDLAQEYNKFYATEKIINDDIEDSNFKLKISQMTAIVLKEGMRLLGIQMPSRM